MKKTLLLYILLALIAGGCVGGQFQVSAEECDPWGNCMAMPSGTYRNAPPLDPEDPFMNDSPYDMYPMDPNY
ncbi:MAG: hypothetical protein HQL01_04930 [Nitrospirae bacterium]|nr:hypothetical protein [Nitrospirota bacterium]